MNNSEKAQPSILRGILTLLLTVILVFVILPYAALLGWFWILDMRDARVAEEIIDVKAAE